MEYIAAVYLMAAVLLGAAGAAKAVAPEPAAAALARLRQPHARWAVRVLGVVELAVAVGAFVLGGPAPAIALTVLYAEFAVVATAMVRSGSTLSCGCFGRVEMPATWRHVIVNIAAAVAGAVAASWPVEPIDQLFESRQWLLTPFCVAVTAGAYGVFMLLKSSRSMKVGLGGSSK